MTGKELARILGKAAEKARDINTDPKGPMVRLRLNPDGIVVHVSHKGLHFTRNASYEHIMGFRGSDSVLELEIATALSEIRKAA